MNEPFRANQESLAERASHLERENAALRAEIVRIRASVAPPEAWSRALRVRGPFLILAIAIALQAGWYVRTFCVIRVARMPTNCTL